MPKKKLQPKKLLCEEILLVDGLGRAGKQLVSKLVSNFERVECFQYSASLEQFLILNFLGHLDKDPSIAFLRLITDELVYNRMIGRNLNTRPSDASSILKVNDYDLYIQRTLQPEGDQAVEHFNKENRLPCFMTHHVIVHFSLFLEAYPSARLVHSVRHPIDLVHSWHSRKWGTRIGSDPRAFALAINVEGSQVPWWGEQTATSYEQMSPIDRVISDVLQLQRLCEKSYRQLVAHQQRQVHYIGYERLFTDATREMKKVAEFFGTEPCNGFDGVLKREHVPQANAISLKARKAKFDYIRLNASAKALDQLHEASKTYELDWDLPNIGKSVRVD